MGAKEDYFSSILHSLYDIDHGGKVEFITGRRDYDGKEGS